MAKTKKQSLLDFDSGKTYRSRYHDFYSFHKIKEGVYGLKHNAKYWRMAGDGDLKWIDPEGGPFIEVGVDSIDGKMITSIESGDAEYAYYLRVKSV